MLPGTGATWWQMTSPFNHCASCQKQPLCKLPKADRRTRLTVILCVLVVVFLSRVDGIVWGGDSLATAEGLYVDGVSAKVTDFTEDETIPEVWCPDLFSLIHGCKRVEVHTQQHGEQ